MSGIRTDAPDLRLTGPDPTRAPDFPLEGTTSEDQAHHPRSGIARRTRLIAVTAGLAAAAAVTVPTANAAGTQTFSASELKSASSSVLKADIPGTAWAIDPATDKVVVTIDSTVSQGELAQIKEAAGENSRRPDDQADPGQVQQVDQGRGRHLCE